MKLNKQAAAIFDVDETLIGLKSMFSFLAFLKQHYPLALGEDFHIKEESLSKVLKSGLAREELNRLYYTLFQDLSEPFIKQAGNDWFEYHANGEQFLVEPVCAQLKEHQKAGYATVSYTHLTLPTKA